MTTTEASLPTENPRMTAKQSYWLGHIKACEAIGQSLSAYAAEHHLALKSCYRWKSRLTQMGLLVETAAAPVFRPVKIKPISMSTERYRITLPNGILVEIQGACDPAQLKQVLTAACCVASL
ncbi:MAG: hypothetical protein Q8L02_06800 [Candidatus Nitrotoga sp.]|nr:hypothetical protein [Candidatus Nitrotoga sp.]